jgi:hypothetical protein
MTTLVIVVFIIGIVGGLARIGHGYSSPVHADAFKRQSRILSGLVGVLMSSIGLIFLWQRVAAPGEILFGILVLSFVMEVAALKWRSNSFQRR